MKSDQEYEDIRKPPLESLLERRVLSAMRTVIGRRLREVWYCCLTDELAPEGLHDPELYIGGELKLLFDDGIPLILTWDEAVGWDHHFSVQARSTSAFVANALQHLEGTELELWRPHLGNQLERARVHGLEGVPHIIELCFPGGSVIVGDGDQRSFADGDDTLVRSGQSLDELTGFELLRTVGTDSADTVEP